MGFPRLSLCLAFGAFAVLQIPKNCDSAPSDGELFLTPLIKSGELDKARAVSEDSMKVSKIKSSKDVKSYSGYLTIDEKSNSNLFFWFFPAQEGPDKAPVILWINEIPGYTSLKGIFLENGPFLLNKDNELEDHPYTWTKTHSVLYIDAPVGSGFSFADDHNAYANNSDEEAAEIYEALKQFFTLFKEFQPRDFYLAGETYAGAFIPHIAKRLDEENAKNDFKVNLKGMIMGSPWLDHHYQILDKAVAYEAFGLVDETTRKQFDKQLQEVLDLANAKKFPEANKLAWDTIGPKDSLFSKETGFSDFRSATRSTPPEQEARFKEFIDSKTVHNYLHVGVHKFIATNQEVYDHFQADFFTGKHLKTLEGLMDKGYRVLIYSPQFDILVPRNGVETIIKNLKWKGADDYAKASRKTWKVEDDVAGYVKSIEGFTFVVLRNSGNYAMMDQPRWTYEMVDNFLYKRDF